MSLRFNCYQCGRVVVVEFKRIGDQVVCPACGATNLIPGSAETETGAPAGLQALTSEDFSTILGDTFRLPFTSLRKLFLISLISAVPMQIFAEIMRSKLLALGPVAEPGQAFRNIFPALMGMTALSIILHSFTGSAMCLAVTDYFLKRPVSVRRSISDSVLRVPTVVVSTLLIGLCAILLTVTLVGFPVAIFLTLAWSLYLPSAVLSRTGPARSLSASAALVKGSWWRVFWILTIIGVGSYLLIFIPSLVAFFLPRAMQAVVALLGSMLLVTLMDLGGFLVFSHLRVRRQGFTLEQLAAEREALSSSS